MRHAAGLLAMVVVTGLPPAKGDPADLPAANNAFAWEIYQELAGGEGNLFFSPYSVEVALAMTMAGARRETASQIAEVLHLDGSDPALHERVQQWQAAVLPAPEDSLITLTVANRLWGQEGLAFAPPFLRLTRERYGAELGTVDFRRGAAAADTINAWVGRATRGRITELVPAGALDASTRLVLTNAIYFLGSWRHPFVKTATSEQPFHVGGREITTATMTQQTRLNYADDDTLQILELPYRAAGAHSLSMILVLPRADDGLATITPWLNAATFDRWVARLAPRLVQVHLPRFETASALQLGDLLATMGMPIAFSGDADFGGMLADAGGPPLAIGEVLHKGWVKVDEKGTEAAAATGVVMSVTSAPPPEEPVVFRADHPFLFVIRDDATGTVLFMGRLVDPRG